MEKEGHKECTDCQHEATKTPYCFLCPYRKCAEAVGRSKTEQNMNRKRELISEAIDAAPQTPQEAAQ